MNSWVDTWRARPVKQYRSDSKARFEYHVSNCRGLQLINPRQSSHESLLRAGGDRQVRPAGAADVRVDRATVRLAEPPAEPEHRPLLAAVHHPEGPSPTRSSGARLLHWHG